MVGVDQSRHVGCARRSTSSEHLTGDRQSSATGDRQSLATAIIGVVNVATTYLRSPISRHWRECPREHVDVPAIAWSLLSLCLPSSPAGLLQSRRVAVVSNVNPLSLLRLIHPPTRFSVLRAR
ncbi:hypothetical protein Y032_0191g1290 [Ancylostoma ceylanicum]|uniref:Uncharacterized protein n=1 Tax=Ancylostoma ceylanicum TaxID=53326 RepID=A0A016SQK2_9BILA|nr:hypothetical protein Y032_0191g1290 [Ancylostoma ceylanicum]